MISKHYRLALLILLQTTIAGCTLIKSADSPAPVKKIGKEDRQSNKSLNKAISLLEQGKAAAAKSILDSILKAVPNDSTAKILILQITSSPEKRYGKNYFKYQVKSGDTFGELAKTHLGNALEFYGLARYNHITNPRSLRVGQWLKIPKVNALIEPSKKAETNDDLASVEQLLANSHFIDALLKLVDKTSNYTINPQTRELYSKIESKLFNSLNSQQSIEQGIKSLDSVNYSVAFKSQMLQTQNQLRHRLLLVKSQTELNNNQIDAAYNHYQQALKLQVSENDLSTSIKVQLSEQLHRKAILYYRDQELERAIHLWDRIMKINPNHESAKAYWTRATKLNVQLKNIEQ